MTRRPTGLSTLADRLIGLEKAGRLAYTGATHDGVHAVTLARGNRLREYRDQEMLGWVDGFTHGLVSTRQPRARRNPAYIAGIRSILVNPSLTDQVRILARLAMQDQGVGVVYLASLAGVTKKAAREALDCGKPGTLGILAALGLIPGLRPELADTPPDTPLQPVPPAGWVEPDSVARVRALGYAHEQGIVAWGLRDRQPHVGRSLFASSFQVLIGDVEVDVYAETVRPWLVGAADAFARDVADRMYHGRDY